jgi:FHS family L-fucose permease-like MFS transporter
MSEKIAFTEKRFVVPFIFVTSLFLMWGVLHATSDELNKHFQDVLRLSPSQSTLIQFSVFGAYFVMSYPAGLFMQKYGFKPGVILGLVLFAAGLFLFVPAANAMSFTFFRVALFIVGCGMATLETVAHPFAAALGDQRKSDLRVNFAQTFNAVGTIIGPSLGAFFLFSEGPASTDLTSVKTLYVGIGIVLLIIAAAFLFLKIPKLSDPHDATHADDAAALNVDTAPKKGLFQHSHFVWACVAQFFNVAAQAGTWAFFINYTTHYMGFSNKEAGYYFSLFMGMMLLGRIVGTSLMTVIAPNKLLALFATGSILMCIIVAQHFGWVSFIALLLINFFFSIMFPTIFSLGLKNLGSHTKKASSFIAMGVVGGAVFPFIMGQVANESIAHAYYMPIICYAVIFMFAYKFYKVKGLQTA